MPLLGIPLILIKESCDSTGWEDPFGVDENLFYYLAKINFQFLKNQYCYILYNIHFLKFGVIFGFCELNIYVEDKCG